MNTSKHTQSQRQEILSYATEHGQKAAAEKYNVSVNTLYNWSKKTTTLKRAGATRIDVVGDDVVIRVPKQKMMTLLLGDERELAEKLRALF